MVEKLAAQILVTKTINNILDTAANKTSLNIYQTHEAADIATHNHAYISLKH